MTTSRPSVLLSLMAAGFISAQQNDSISGVVASPKGPETGVWVIADTTDLRTRYIKEVVTDDQGQYLIPGCPQRIILYGPRIWVGGFAEGYGEARATRREYEANRCAG